MLTKDNIAARVRNYLISTYGQRPLYSITRNNELEVHTGGWRERLESIGFVYLRAGYFSSIYSIPESILQ